MEPSPLLSTRGSQFSKSHTSICMFVICFYTFFPPVCVEGVWECVRVCVRVCVSVCVSARRSPRLLVYPCTYWLVPYPLCMCANVCVCAYTCVRMCLCFYIYMHGMHGKVCMYTLWTRETVRVPARVGWITKNLHGNV